MTRRQQFGSYLLLGTAFMLGLLGLINAINLPAIMLALSIALLLCMPIQKIKAMAVQPIRNFALVLIPLLLVWPLLSAFWALDSGRAISAALKMSGVMLLCLCGVAAFQTEGLRHVSARCVIWAVLGGAYAGAVLILIDRAVFDGLVASIFGYDPRFYYLREVSRGLAFIMVAAWPVMGYFLFKKHYVALSLTILWLLVLAWLNNSMAAKLGIIAGSVSLLFLLYLPRLSRIAMRFGIPLFICIWPYSFSQLYEPVFLSEGVYRVLPNSSRHRIAIWDFAIEKVQQKPLTGWGANNSYVVPGADGYYDENAGMRIMPVYPHNFIIQVVLELGVIGLAVLAVVAHLLLRRWDAIQQPAFKATMGSCIIVYCVMSMSSFNVWHSWWMCVPVITCWLFYILSAKGDEPCSPART